MLWYPLWDKQSEQKLGGCDGNHPQKLRSQKDRGGVVFGDRISGGVMANSR